MEIWEFLKEIDDFWWFFVQNHVKSDKNTSIYCKNLYLSTFEHVESDFATRKFIFFRVLHFWIDFFLQILEKIHQNLKIFAEKEQTFVEKVDFSLYKISNL